MKTIVLATKNLGKLEELKTILEGIDINIISSVDAGFDQEVEENLKTLQGNSLKKARVVSKELGLPAVADDSGLFIDALGGKPGVHSKRWAGEDATDEERVRYTLEQLKGVKLKDRGATFKTVAAFFFPDGKSQLFEGAVHGKIATKPKGSARPGMPYDLLFMPENLKTTFAQMSMESKNHFSHRSRAFKKFREYLLHILKRP